MYSFLEAMLTLRTSIKGEVRVDHVRFLTDFWFQNTARTCTDQFDSDHSGFSHSSRFKVPKIFNGSERRVLIGPVSWLALRTPDQLWPNLPTLSSSRFSPNLQNSPQPLTPSLSETTAPPPGRFTNSCVFISPEAPFPPSSSNRYPSLGHLR